MDSFQNLILLLLECQLAPAVLQVALPVPVPVAVPVAVAVAVLVAVHACTTFTDPPVRSSY